MRYFNSLHIQNCINWNDPGYEYTPVYFDPTADAHRVLFTGSPLHTMNRGYITAIYVPNSMNTVIIRGVLIRDDDVTTELSIEEILIQCKSLPNLQDTEFNLEGYTKIVPCVPFFWTGKNCILQARVNQNFYYEMLLPSIDQSKSNSIVPNCYLDETFVHSQYVPNKYCECTDFIGFWGMSYKFNDEPSPNSNEYILHEYAKNTF